MSNNQRKASTHPNSRGKLAHIRPSEITTRTTTRETLAHFFRGKLPQILSQDEVKLLGCQSINSEMGTFVENAVPKLVH